MLYSKTTEGNLKSKTVIIYTKWFFWGVSVCLKCVHKLHMFITALWQSWQKPTISNILILLKLFLKHWIVMLLIRLLSHNALFTHLSWSLWIFVFCVVCLLSGIVFLLKSSWFNFCFLCFMFCIVVIPPVLCFRLFSASLHTPHLLITSPALLVILLQNQISLLVKLFLWLLLSFV